MVAASTVTASTARNGGSDSQPVHLHWEASATHGLSGARAETRYRIAWLSDSAGSAEGKPHSAAIADRISSSTARYALRPARSGRKNHDRKAWFQVRSSGPTSQHYPLSHDQRPA